MLLNTPQDLASAKRRLLKIIYFGRISLPRRNNSPPWTQIVPAPLATSQGCPPALTFAFQGLVSVQRGPFEISYFGAMSLPRRQNSPPTSGIALVSLAMSHTHSSRHSPYFRTAFPAVQRRFELFTFGQIPLPRNEIAFQWTEFFVSRNTTSQAHYHTS